MLRQSKSHDSSHSRFFPPDLFPASLVYFVLPVPLRPPPLLLNRTQRRSENQRQGAPKASQPQYKPIYFPSSHRLHLRDHQRAPLEPLKPLFPNMKEGNQNRDMKKGEEPQERRLICLFWGITQRGFLPPGLLRPVCPLEVQCEK